MQKNRQNQREWEQFWQNLSEEIEVPSIVWELMDETKAAYLLNYIGSTGGWTLEVGCGSARLSSRLARAGYYTVGLDSSLNALKYAQNTYSKTGSIPKGLLLGDGLNLPFANAVFDGVLSTGLIEHFVEPLPLMKEMLRVVKSGGFFYADILPKKKWRLLVFFDFIRPLLGRDIEPLFEMPFSRKDIETFVEKIGLENWMVFPAGIFLPRLPIFRGSKILIELENVANRFLHPFFKRLDGTGWAEVFGVYYFVFGRK